MFNYLTWYNKTIANKDVLFSFKGEIDSENISEFLDNAEGKLKQKNEKNQLIRKTYNILVESLQNLYHHSLEVDFKNDRINNFSNKNEIKKFSVAIFSKEDFSYKITTGNFIKNEKIQDLSDKINQINSLSLDEIKALYKLILCNQEFTNHGGGGLGLIDIAKRTNSRFNYSFEKYNKDFSFFSLIIEIK